MQLGHPKEAWRGATKLAEIEPGANRTLGVRLDPLPSRPVTGRSDKPLMGLLARRAVQDPSAAPTSLLGVTRLLYAAAYTVSPVNNLSNDIEATKILVLIN